MEECSICLETIEEKDRYELLKCPHVYHKKCILKWLEKSNTCPECRQIIPNIFSIKTKNYGFSQKNILEIDYINIKVYDKDFDKLKFKLSLGYLEDLKIYDNRLEIKYILGNFFKKKNLYFKSQNYCLIFYRLLIKVYDHFVENYLQ